MLGTRVELCSRCGSERSEVVRSPAFTVPGRPAEGDQPNSPAFFLPASSFSASNAQSATSHFFQSRGREGGWQKYEATGVFWNKSVFSYRSVVTKNDRKSDVRSFRDRLFREKHCGPRGSRASSHRWQSAWLCASKKPAPRITLDAAHAPRDARIDSSSAPRTPPASPPTAAGRVSPRRASPARRTPRGRPRTVWNFLDSTRIALPLDGQKRDRLLRT